MPGRVTTTGFFSGEHEDDESGKHELNLSARIESDINAGTVEYAFESRKSQKRHKVSGAFNDMGFAQKMAYLQHEMDAAERAEAYRSRPVTPCWKPERREEEARIPCPNCNGMASLGDWVCEDCGGQGWIRA